MSSSPINNHPSINFPKASEEDIYALMRKSMLSPVPEPRATPADRVAPQSSVRIAPTLPVLSPPGLSAPEAGKIVRRLFMEKLPPQTKIWKHEGGKVIIEFPPGQQSQSNAQDIAQALACLGLSGKESPGQPIQVTEIKDITRRVTAYQIALTPPHMQVLQIKLQSAVPEATCRHIGITGFLYCSSCCHFLKDKK